MENRKLVTGVTRTKISTLTNVETVESVNILLENISPTKIVAALATSKLNVFLNLFNVFWQFKRLARTMPKNESIRRLKAINICPVLWLSGALEQSMRACIPFHSVLSNVTSYLRGKYHFLTKCL